MVINAQKGFHKTVDDGVDFFQSQRTIFKLPFKESPIDQLLNLRSVVFSRRILKCATCRLYSVRQKDDARLSGVGPAPVVSEIGFINQLTIDCLLNRFDIEILDEARSMVGFNRIHHRLREP